MQIYSGKGEDTIICQPKSQNNYIDGGNNSDIITFYGSSNEVHGGYGNDKITAYNDGTNPTGGNIIYGETGTDLIVINDGNLTTRKSNNTIVGGADDDIIVIENTKIPVVIQYSKGDGNDIIYGYSSDDTIKINKSDYTVSDDGQNTEIKIGDDSIILMDYKGKTPKIIKTDEDILPLGVTADKKNTTLTIKNEFRGGNVSLEDYANTFTKINASGLSATQSINITGNSSANSLKGGKSSDTISGGKGKDTLYGGDGDDTIYGDADNDILYGDAGNDILNGGKGNNTLSGGKGADIFVYGGGNDSITDYKPGEDKIKIENVSITNATFSGSNVILNTANGGKISLKGVKDKAITFIDKNGNTTDKIFFGNSSYSPLETGLT